MNDKAQKITRICQDEIGGVAAEAVARALASREKSMRELNAEEVNDVSGGALLKSPIIYGGDLLGTLKGLNTLNSLNTLNPATLNVAATLTTVG